MVLARELALHVVLEVGTARSETERANRQLYCRVEKMHFYIHNLTTVCVQSSNAFISF